MVPGPDGLIPEPGALERTLETLTPKGLKLFWHTFDPLLDSAGIGAEHWNLLIDLIADFQGEGVIVTHGTDTMSFTGAALSQALTGIGIPVVLCGSMHPLNARADAEANLALALDAAVTAPPEVWLAFAGKLLSAAGLVKHDSRGEDAFRSVPQAKCEATCGFRPRHFGPLRLAILTLSPLLPASAVGAALAELDGAVLRVFGAGTVMSNPELEQVLSAATGRGCRIRAVSQCESGGLTPGAYAAGAPLWRAGVENGGAETPEAALARLWLDMSNGLAGGF